MLYSVLTICQNRNGGIEPVKKNIGSKLALYPMPITVIGDSPLTLECDVLAKCLSFKPEK